MPESATLDTSDLFRPTARQRQFMRAVAAHDFVLYGGAAGGGKSYVLRWGLIQLLLELHAMGVRGPRVGLFCEDYPALQDRHLSKLQYEVPARLGTFNAATHELRLATGGVLAFRNLDDPSKYLSAEFAAAGVDELTRNPVAVFNFLRMRLRWPGVARPKFMAASNPGGPGHAWVKQLFIDRDFSGDFANLAPQAGRFAYIPARATDNPHLPPGYYENLLTLPPALARAYAEGDWDLFAGQVFAEWRADTHVVEPFDVPAWWRCWLCNDAGQAEPAAWHLLAASPEGQVYVIREWTFRNREWYSDQAARVAADLREMGRTPQLRVTGLDSFAPRFERGKGIVDVYAEAGLSGWDKPNPDGHPNRKARAAMVHEYLKPYAVKDRLRSERKWNATQSASSSDGSTYDDGGIALERDSAPQTARLQVFDTCRELIRTLPTLVSDENHPEEVAESDADHWYDSLSYGLVAWHVRRSTEPERPAFAPGTAGQVLDHGRKLAGGERRRGPFS